MSIFGVERRGGESEENNLKVLETRINFIFQHLVPRSRNHYCKIAFSPIPALQDIHTPPLNYRILSFELSLDNIAKPAQS